MFIPIILFIVGLVLLIKGGDWFVDGAVGIAHRFRIPELLIGATVVSIGTTLPEVMVSATSALGGHGEMAYGNAIGSVICNASLIAALTAAVRPGSTDRKAIALPAAFFFASALLYSATAYLLGSFSRIIGIILLGIFAAYMAISITKALKSKDLEALTDTDGDGEVEPHEIQTLIKDIVLLVVGAALIAVGADLLVDNGTLIAAALGVPEAVIALTFIALGTSLPELVTAITSLAKGHGALSLGNVIGANLFNLVLVSGVSAALSPFDIPASKTIAGINSSLVLDIPVMLGVMALLTVPAIVKGRLYRWQGVLLMCVYAAFCVMQFVI